MTRGFLIFLVAFFFFTSCKKDDFITHENARVQFSADTLKFDTVFTTLGSTTRRMKIKNNNDQHLRFSSIRLMGGNNSPFKINVNGVAQPEVYNIEVAPQDSIYIYVTVNIESTSDFSPFLIRDSIEVAFNGQQRFVQLEAYGQNAIIITNQVINGTQVWTPNLPIVVLESLTVRETGTLTLSAGTRMYFHATAPFIIQGTLIVNGTKDRPVVFRGDRLDDYYRDIPGSWPGIIFTPTSKNSSITFAEIHNAVEGIKVSEPSVNANPKLTLRQSIINNAYNIGLYCSNTDIEMFNCLITNNRNNVVLENGGNYNFIHCTVAGMSNKYYVRMNPSLQISNGPIFGNNNSINAMNAVITNSIIWGMNNTDVDEVGIFRNGGSAFGVTLQHCLFRTGRTLTNATLINCWENTNPEFDLVDIVNNEFDFHTNATNAPGVNQGIYTGILKDLDDNDRSDGLPDIGAYEKQ